MKEKFSAAVTGVGSASGGGANQQTFLEQCCSIKSVNQSGEFLSECHRQILPVVAKGNPAVNSFERFQSAEQKREEKNDSLH